jgi:hypothetical protein
MNVDTERARQSPTETGLVLAGYVCAVTAATLAYLIVSALVILPGGPSNASLSEMTVPLIAMAIAGVFFWMVAFFAAMPPFLASYAIAQRLKLHNVFYYLLCGAITGLVLTPLAELIGDWLLPTGEPPVRGVLENWAFAAPRFMFVGACGALAFWYMAARRIGLSIGAVSGQS